MLKEAMVTKVKFHISDILALGAGQVSLPECPPLDANGTRMSPRRFPMEGIIQLIEHLTGKDMRVRLHPVTGRLEGAGEDFMTLLGPAQQELVRQCKPLLTMVDLTTLPVKKSQTPADQLAAMRAAKEALEAKYGAYVEIEGPDRKQAPRPASDRGWDAGRN